MTTKLWSKWSLSLVSGKSAVTKRKTDDENDEEDVDDYLGKQKALTINFLLLIHIFNIDYDEVKLVNHVSDAKKQEPKDDLDGKFLTEAIERLGPIITSIKKRFDESGNGHNVTQQQAISKN